MYDVYLVYKKQHGLSPYMLNCYRNLQMAEKAIVAIDKTAKLLKSNVEHRLDYNGELYYFYILCLNFADP
tara:strand:+ start:986 stop:1195 length:210 start_codon:yes stop_codon:yes gene_type:complete